MIPFSNFILRAQKLFARTSHTSVRSKVKKQIAKTDIGIIIVSVIIALVVCGYAFSQLIGVSETFAALGNGITNFMVNIISIDTISDLVYSFFDDKKIPAAQIGILFAAVTFSLTVCGNF